jgi:hypothetical protein
MWLFVIIVVTYVVSGGSTVLAKFDNKHFVFTLLVNVVLLLLLDA